MPQLLVFARAPVPGTVKTRLAALLGDEGACRIYAAFLADLASELAGLDGVDVTWCVAGDRSLLRAAVGTAWRTEPQGEGNLGARLRSAFRAAFARGPGPVAVVGSDAPLLAAADLRALFAAVETPLDAALLPAEDGGYAALALGALCDDAFRGVPWSTPRTLAATRTALAAAGRRVHLLPAVRDVDTGDDLDRLARDLAAAPGRAPATRAALEAWGLSAPEVLVDALGRRVPTQPLPRRIVSLVPSVTECLFDTGLGPRVVGRTDYCISPPQASAVPSVGGPKTVDLGRLRALAPDLVLANAEENDRAQVESLIAAGLRVHVAFPRTLADAAAFLRDLGLLLDTRERLGELAARLEALPPPPGPAVRCACLIWKAPYMTASADTLTSALLEAAGAANVFEGRAERYPTVSEEDLASSGARVVLLPSEPYEFSEADVGEVERLAPGASALRIPGEWVTWYGSRMVEAIEGLRRALDDFRSHGYAAADHRPQATSHRPRP